jgi:acyl carrier protein
MAAQAAVRSEAQAASSLERVLRLADAMLAKKGRPAAGADQDLRGAGLSSLDGVNLMLAVEGEFDLFIPQGEMTPENFRSATSIAALVDRLA